MTTIDTAKLAAAFKTLTRQGYVARQAPRATANASYDVLHKMVDAMPEARRANVKGLVFFGREQETALERGVGYLAVHFSRTDRGAELDAAVAVGAAAAEAFRAAGLRVEWDGSVAGTVKVLAD